MPKKFWRLRLVNMNKMKKSGFLILFIGNIFYSFAQKDSVAIVLNQAQIQLEKSDSYADESLKLIKKAALKKNVVEIKLLVSEANILAIKAEKSAKMAEKKSDLAEIISKKIKCQDAAYEADDAESYCRHIAFFTHEMVVYTQKISEENELTFVQEYLNKAIAFGQDAYEAVKNAKIELSDALKDLDLCE